MKALNLAIRTGLPEQGRSLRPTHKHLKTYRAETKKLLHAVQNAINLMLPGYDFSKSTFARCPQPRCNRERYLMTEEEKRLLGLPPDRTLHFLHEPGNAESVVDFPDYTSSPVRLIWAADEGTEGYGCFLHLAFHGVAVVMWPDTAHKIHRKQAKCLSSVPEARSLLQLLTKVFRSSRGPYSTNRFGRARLESRSRLIDGLEACPESSLLQTCLAGLARDVQMPAASMTPKRALSMLKAVAGTSSEIRVKWAFPCFHCPCVRQAALAQ